MECVLWWAGSYQIPTGGNHRQMSKENWAAATTVFTFTPTHTVGQNVELSSGFVVIVTACGEAKLYFRKAWHRPDIMWSTQWRQTIALLKTMPRKYRERNSLYCANGFNPNALSLLKSLGKWLKSCLTPGMLFAAAALPLSEAQHHDDHFHYAC